MTTPRTSRPAAGFSLIELSIVMIIIGIIITTIARLAPSLILSSKTKENAAILANVQSAINGFAAAQNRLPCPDSGADGVSDGCNATTNEVGNLPFATLGLSSGADAYGNAIRYGVYYSLAATGMERSNFCSALASAASAALDTDNLYLADSEASDGTIGDVHVAVAVASMGFDTAFATGSANGDALATSVENPATTYLTGAEYDDQVRATPFNILASNLDCGKYGLRIVTTSLPDGTDGNPYSAQIVGDGGDSNGYAWCLSSTVLSAGLSTSPNSACPTTTSSSSMTVSGTPVLAVPGTPEQGSLTVQLSDGSSSVSKSFTFNIN